MRCHVMIIGVCIFQLSRNDKELDCAKLIFLMFSTLGLKDIVPSGGCERELNVLYTLLFENIFNYCYSIIT